MPVFFILAFMLWRPDVGSASLEYEYRQALSTYKELLKDSQRQKERYNWFVCVEKFKAVYLAQPNGPWSDDAVFMIGDLYSRLSKLFPGGNDKHEALDYFSRLLRRFPDSPYASKTRKAITLLRKSKKSGHKKVEPRSDGTKKGVKKSRHITETELHPLKKKEYKAAEKPLAEVDNVRVWSNPDYTRVVIDVEKEVYYNYRLLRKDPAIGKPPRLYVDVRNARVGADLERIVPIGDDLLSNVRTAQYGPKVVRVVLDIKSIDDFKIFSLKDPFRIVLDVNGIAGKEVGRKEKKRKKKTAGSKEDLPKNSLAKQLALGVKRIVIDPGHGGKDPGAVGYYKGVLEKNVTLEVSRRLAKKLRAKLGCEVILTREKDVSLSLEERTAIANMKRADIFISIHANAHRNRNVCGVETYFLNLATDNEAIMVAARENATSAKNISDLEVILNDLMNNAKINESSALADHVQGAMIQKLAPLYKIKDNGVKQAPFYVLLGAEMPCVLVEIAFISNPRECRRLNMAGYQNEVADAIVEGVKDYIKGITPTALNRNIQGLTPNS